MEDILKKIKNSLINDFENSFWTEKRLQFLDKELSDNNLYEKDINVIIGKLKKI